MHFPFQQIYHDTSFSGVLPGNAAMVPYKDCYIYYLVCAPLFTLNLYQIFVGTLLLYELVNLHYYLKDLRRPCPFIENTIFLLKSYRLISFSSRTKLQH